MVGSWWAHGGVPRGRALGRSEAEAEARGFDFPSGAQQLHGGAPRRGVASNCPEPGATEKIEGVGGWVGVGVGGGGGGGGGLGEGCSV